MDDVDTPRPNQEQLDDLESEIQEARHHLGEEAHEEPRDHEFFEDDQSKPEEEGMEDEEQEGPGNDNVPA